MANYQPLTFTAAALLASAALVATAEADMSKLNMDVAYSATRIIEGGAERGTQLSSDWSSATSSRAQ
jgi:hypothetical protein